MKHGKRPTKKHKLILVKHGLHPNKWLVVKNLEDRLEVVSKETGNLKTIHLED